MKQNVPAITTFQTTRLLWWSFTWKKLHRRIYASLSSTARMRCLPPPLSNLLHVSPWQHLIDVTLRTHKHVCLLLRWSWHLSVMNSWLVYTSLYLELSSEVSSIRAWYICFILSSWSLECGCLGMVLHRQRWSIMWHFMRCLQSVEVFGNSFALLQLIWTSVWSSPPYLRSILNVRVYILTLCLLTCTYVAKPSWQHSPQWWQPDEPLLAPGVLKSFLTQGSVFPFMLCWFWLIIFHFKVILDCSSWPFMVDDLLDAAYVPPNGQGGN